MAFAEVFRWFFASLVLRWRSLEKIAKSGKTNYTSFQCVSAVQTRHLFNTRKYPASLLRDSADTVIIKKSLGLAPRSPHRREKEMPLKAFYFFGLFSGVAPGFSVTAQWSGWNQFKHAYVRKNTRPVSSTSIAILGKWPINRPWSVMLEISFFLSSLSFLFPVSISTSELDKKGKIKERTPIVFCFEWHLKFRA